MNRLPIAPATDIDALIWWQVAFERFGRGNPWRGKFLVDAESDRRDADLMLFSRVYRHRTFPVDMPPLRVRGSYGMVIDCGGHLWDLDPVHRHGG